MIWTACRRRLGQPARTSGVAPSPSSSKQRWRCESARPPATYLHSILPLPLNLSLQPISSRHWPLCVVPCMCSMFEFCVYLCVFVYASGFAPVGLRLLTITITSTRHSFFHPCTFDARTRLFFSKRHALPRNTAAVPYLSKSLCLRSRSLLGLLLPAANSQDVVNGDWESCLGRTSSPRANQAHQCCRPPVLCVSNTFPVCCFSCDAAWLGPQGDDERSSTPPLKEGSASKHVVPSWAGPAANDLSLLVIKDGVEVQTLPINDRSFYVIGEWVWGERCRGGSPTAVSSWNRGHLDNRRCTTRPAGMAPRQQTIRSKELS